MRAFRIPITAIVAALALSGCMRTAGPVAQVPQDDLDSLAYGQRYGSPPAVAANAGDGTVRAAYAAAPRVPAMAGMAPAARGERGVLRHDAPYQLDAGDKLRVVVYGQEGLTNTYAVSAGGTITMPLIGSVPARGRTTAGLAAEIAAKLRSGFIREPSVAVEIETYRPFFILGEVAAPGQYPYVPNMTVESAVAIAGGFSPRARRDHVTVTHTDDASGTARYVVPPGSPISPGDTVQVGERWF